MPESCCLMDGQLLDGYRGGRDGREAEREGRGEGREGGRVLSEMFPHFSIVVVVVGIL